MRPIVDIVADLKEPRILVVGDLLLDHTIGGTVRRLSAEASCPILDAERDRETMRPGGAANVAVNVSAMGAKAVVAGMVGMGDFTEDLLVGLRRARVETAGIVASSGWMIPVKMRVIDQYRKQLLRIDHEEKSPTLEKGALEELVSSVSALQKGVDLTVASDYGKGTLHPYLCKEIMRSRKPVIVGLKGGDPGRFNGATGATVNRKELHEMTGRSDVMDAARMTLRDLNLRWLVVTLGSDGMTVFPCGGREVSFPSYSKGVVDVTGAGDTVLAVMACGWASGIPLLECVELASRAAAIKVGTFGTVPVTWKEVQDSHDHSGAGKIVDYPELLKVARRARCMGQKIAMTGGCFDLLHEGHLSTLEFAKKQGDILIVAVNGDASVTRLKGAERPVLRLASREKMLAALSCVDYVAAFHDDTPEKLLEMIRPDVWVKGGDWREKTIPEQEFCGRVEFAPVLEGMSTSLLVKAIQATA